jgi:hypothetical protein
MGELAADEKLWSVGDAIRHAIDAAIEDGADQTAEELEAILLIVPVKHRGYYREQVFSDLLSFETCNFAAID